MKVQKNKQKRKKKRPLGCSGEGVLVSADHGKTGGERHSCKLDTGGPNPVSRAWFKRGGETTIKKHKGQWKVKQMQPIQKRSRKTKEREGGNDWGGQAPSFLKGGCTWENKGRETRREFEHCKKVWGRERGEDGAKP